MSADVFSTVRRPLTDRPWPLEPLELAAWDGRPLHRGNDCELCGERGCWSDRAFADRIGVAPVTVTRWRRKGLTDVQADHSATALRVHPRQVWDGWDR